MRNVTRTGDEVVIEETGWMFPSDRFVEYGPEDERWAQVIGFGTEVVDTRVLSLATGGCEPRWVMREWSCRP